MWHIHGKTYDLTTFMDSHPGGAEILEKTKHQSDISSLFETYHAFANKEVIMKRLSEYELPSDVSGTLTDYTEYNELTTRIKESTALKTRQDIKAPWWSYIQVALTGLIYMASFLTAIFGHAGPIGSCALAVLSGICWISIGFTAMHDASHYAISMDPLVNTTLSRVWNSFGLWNHSLWFYHHVYHHHSFTNQDTDPDVYHYIPFAKKNSRGRTRFPVSSYFLLFIAFIFPGFYLGQAYVYFTKGFLKKKLFTITIPSTIAYYSAAEIALSAIKLALLMYCKWYVALSYMIAVNTTYHINIVGDHDTFETHVENKYTGQNFLRAQICNSGNFLTKNYVWTHLFGGINHQIEHHLFPSMSHKHYPTIAPIVKEYCKEKHIRYVEHHSLIDVYISFLKMIDYYSH